jgi:hypothetical protein
MISDLRTRGAVFMDKWIEDNIAFKRLPEWDQEFVGKMKLMCLAEAAIVGIDTRKRNTRKLWKSRVSHRGLGL